MAADTRMPESRIAPYLTELQTRVKKEGIRIGSCKFNAALPAISRSTNASFGLGIQLTCRSLHLSGSTRQSNWT